MPRRALVGSTIAFVLVASSTAAADPADLPRDHVTVESSDVTIVVPGPTPKIFGLPVGSHVLTPPAWERTDVEFKRLQEAETRLKAENDSFRKTMQSWQPGWKTAASVLVVGIATGMYLGLKF